MVLPFQAWNSIIPKNSAPGFVRQFFRNQKEKRIANCISYKSSRLYTSYFFGCLQWEKVLDKDTRKEELFWAPFFPYKCFPPKSVNLGPLSLLLSICKTQRRLLRRCWEILHSLHLQAKVFWFLKSSPK